MTQAVKPCTKCGGPKTGKHVSWCLACKAALTRAWQAADPERAKASDRASYLAHWARRNLSEARKRAERKGVPFSITADDIFVPDTCPVLGIPIVPGSGGKHDGSPTIDRIIPELGYVPGNVQVISDLANRMKSNASPEHLLTFADWVYKNYGGA